MSPRPKQSQQHPDSSAAITETARKQMAENGAAPLSLRAIARELSITAPAIYNYFPSRDNLVTALIVDTCHFLAASQESDEQSHTKRIMASARQPRIIKPPWNHRPGRRREYDRADRDHRCRLARWRACNRSHYPKYIWNISGMDRSIQL